MILYFLTLLSMRFTKRPTCCHVSGSLLHYLFTLTKTSFSGIFSVALSIDVTTIQTLSGIASERVRTFLYYHNSIIAISHTVLKIRHIVLNIATLFKRDYSLLILGSIFSMGSNCFELSSATSLGRTTCIPIRLILPSYKN